MIRRLTKADYMTLAEDKGFIHQGTPPNNVKTRTGWRCKRCGKVSERTYRGVQVGHGCSCKSSKTKQPADYRALAIRLGIEWVWDPEEDFSYPTNTKTATKWKNPKTGEIVICSWHTLTHHIRTDIAEALGLNDEHA